MITGEELRKRIKDLIAHKHEEEWFEFKANWYEPHALGEYISALSNAATLQGEEYGFFVWGVENNTHKVVGSDFDFHQDVKNEPLKHYLARQTEPDIGFEFQEVTVEGQRLVVLIIPAAQKMPTAFDNVRYIRIGSSKAKLMKYPEHESQLFYVLRNGFPTIANTASEFQDLTFNKLFVYFESKGVTLSRRTFKKNLGLLTTEGKYNILAQLLSDDSHITIRFALFAGDTKSSTMYSVKECGYTCILYSLDQVLDYGRVLNIPQADERERRTVRKEVPLFNAEAYEEAVINAFVHNRWLDGNAPMFTGFQNRIEILSRGNLPPKQTLEGFYDGVSVPVNEALSRIFIMLHITEHTGRGIPRITDVYGRDTIAIKENTIVVTIPYDRLGDEVYGNAQDKVGNAQDDAQEEPQNAQDKTEIVQDDNIDREQMILQFCMVARSMIDILNYLNVKDRRTVRKILDPLIEQGRVARTVPDKPNSKNQKYITIR